ncbi:MAG: DUF123 domain-containing protein [Nitrososphaerales archaeon]
MTSDCYITLFGGVGEIGGNSILVEDKGSMILLDLGKDFDRYGRFSQFPSTMPARSVQKELRNIKGTYTLIVFVAGKINLRIGSLGTFAFEKGWYAYTGSALGPAGLLGRIRRHLKKDKKSFWHIDYLLKSRHSSIKATVYTKAKERHECKIVKEIVKKNTKPIKGFGASDCNKGCKSHLHYMGDDFEATLKSVLDAYGNLNLIASFRLFELP